MTGATSVSPGQGPDAPSALSAGRLPIGRMISVILVVILAGGLFGYDQGVISGALIGIEKEFSLGPFLLEVVTSWVTLGALFGSLGGGYVADHFGRRAALLTAAVLFVAGALIEAFAPGLIILVAGRFIVGFGVGVAAVAAPLYAAELAPADQRGRFISSYQLAITIGIFLAYFVDEALAGPQGWRLMLGVSAVPGLLLFVATLPASQSPRWLLKMRRTEDARRTIETIWPGEDTEARLNAIQELLEDESHTVSWAEIFAPRWREPLKVGLGLAILQQITGINAIIYYSNTIFAAAGFATPESQASATTWAIGGVNVLATFIALAFIDRLGRRPLLMAGLVGMTVSLIAVGLAFLQLSTMGEGAHATTGIVTLVSLIVFIVSFAFSLGPVTWTMINEIYPGAVRGRAVAAATAVNWGAAFLVSQFFLTAIKGLGPAYAFWLFAAFCLGGLVWVYLRVPETKGRSLEQIEALWRSRSDSASRS